MLLSIRRHRVRAEFSSFHNELSRIKYLSAVEKSNNAKGLIPLLNETLTVHSALGINGNAVKSGKKLVKVFRV